MAESTWTARELPILEAVRGAEEAGENLSTAARRAVPDLPLELYARTLNSLAADRLLDVDVQWAGGKPYVAIVQRLLPGGRRAVGQWPSKDLDVELERVLSEAIEREPDPERKSRLEGLRATIAEAGRGVVTAVLIEWAKRITLGE